MNHNGIEQRDDTEVKRRQKVIQFYFQREGTSFIEYLVTKENLKERRPLRTLIEEQIKVFGGGYNLYQQIEQGYFNYDLTLDTWRLVVNKQILCTFERLLYERQIHELKKRTSALEKELEKVNKQILQTQFERREFEKQMNSKKGSHRHSGYYQGEVLGKRSYRPDVPEY